ncbi:substrate-binding domain-containing protein [Streptomonospora sediminis]
MSAVGGSRARRQRRAAGAAPLAAAAALVAAAAGCTWGEDDPFTGPGEAGELRVLAGSEIKDLQPLLKRAEEETGVTVHLEYTGTLEGVDQVVSGAAAERYDAVWFSSNRYLNLLPEGDSALRSETPVMASPVVMAVTESSAEELGWSGGAKVTWADIADAAAKGDLRFGMTNPAASNSGFSALIGVASALSDTGTALRSSDIAEVTPQLKEFFSGQQLTSGSSGWLADAYVRGAGGGGSQARLDGLVNYESVLLSLNESGDLPEPLTLIYPEDGAVTADYPLSLLDSAGDDVADGYDRLVEHLMSPQVQQEISETTHRRPLAPGAAGTGSGTRYPTVTELPFPAREQVATDLIEAYFDEIRRPARTLYVLDVSGSMRGGRIEDMRAAMDTLTGGDSDSVSGRFQRFYARERVTLLPFESTVGEGRTFTVPPEQPGPVLADIRETVAGLDADGGTAGYDALDAAFDRLADESGGGDRFTSIVLMTDGEVNAGMSLEEFTTAHKGYPAELRSVPVFPVVFGESDPAEMEELAGLTGGRAFDARDDSLDQAFREIRGYQ